MKDHFKFQLFNVQIECAHCSHQLEGVAKFGLAIVECANCGKYSQITSSAEATRVRTPIAIEER